MPDLFHRIQVAAAREKVLEAISTSEGLSRWWAAASAAKGEVGHVNVFAFDDGTLEFHFRVDAREDVVWSVRFTQIGAIYKCHKSSQPQLSAHLGEAQVCSDSPIHKIRVSCFCAGAIIPYAHMLPLFTLLVYAMSADR